MRPETVNSTPKACAHTWLQLHGDIRTQNVIACNRVYARATFYMWTRWAKTHPLGQIAHPLQAFRPNGLIDYFSNFSKIILRKIIKIAATRCHILKLKCTKFDFRPRWGSLQRSPDPLAGFKGPTSKGREGRGGRWEEGRTREGRGRAEGSGGEGRKGRRWAKG